MKKSEFLALDEAWRRFNLAVQGYLEVPFRCQ